MTIVRIDADFCLFEGVFFHDLDLKKGQLLLKLIFQSFKFNPYYNKNCGKCGESNGLKHLKQVWRGFGPQRAKIEKVFLGKSEDLTFEVYRMIMSEAWEDPRARKKIKRLLSLVYAYESG